MTVPVPESVIRCVDDAFVEVFAGRFADALLRADGDEAETVIHQALASGLAPEAIQTLVMGPAMMRIGERWESRDLEIGEEHLASSICHRALIPLFEALHAGAARRARERIVLAAVEGQHHVLGLRMVADVLEGAGFAVLYLGGDVPADSLRQFVAEHQSDVAVLGCGMGEDVTCLADSLWAIHEVAPEVRMVIGGLGIPRELQDAGYPYLASTIEVVKTVESLLAGSSQPFPPAFDLVRSKGRVRDRPPEPTKADAMAHRLGAAAGEAADLARGHVRRATTYRDLAFRDSLTDLPNRRAFDEKLKAYSDDPEGTAQILIIDVDFFKEVNDELGHLAGDQLLIAIGNAVSGSLRIGDLAARLGGDEFGALLPGASASVAREVSDRIRVAVARMATPAVTVSVGTAELLGDSRQAMLSADISLYEEKVAGSHAGLTA